MTHGSGNPFARTAGAASALAQTLAGNVGRCKVMPDQPQAFATAVIDFLGR